MVCFTYPVLESGEIGHDDVAHRLKAAQLAWISKVRLANRVNALRASVTNYETGGSDIERLVAALNEAVGLPEFYGQSPSAKSR